jgi:hypothetical protein
MRLIVNLLPLIRQSPRPRILSVLNGGREKPMREDDIGLEHHWASRPVMNHITTMTSLSHQHLAENDKGITILHAYPGLVRTDIFVKLKAPEPSGLMKRMALTLLRSVVAVLMLIIGTSPEESGERQAFHLISDIYTPGAWRINNHSDIVTKPGVLEGYETRGWREKIWEHTLRVFDKALSL